MFKMGHKTQFGSFIKELRIEREKTLRQFCKEAQFDPSNWSKIERGVLPPPQDVESLEKIARVLGIGRGSTEWRKLFDYASVDRGIIPDDILSDEEALECLPTFFRTVRGEKPTEEELERLYKLLKRG